MKGGIQMEEILRVEKLRKTFVLCIKQQRLEKTKEKTKKAAHGNSFTAYRGEVFGLLGPNGAGKTTTLRMLATLIRTDEGDALIEGISVCKDPAGVRERIGSVSYTHLDVYKRQVLHRGFHFMFRLCGRASSHTSDSCQAPRMHFARQPFAAAGSSYFRRLRHLSLLNTIPECTVSYISNL